MPRPRKPTALKLLDGNPGKTPILKEPEPPGELLKPPGLRGRASDIWDGYAPILVGMGTLKSADAHQFSIWCKLAAMSERKFLSMTTAQLSEMRRIGGEFGMSATGRAKLGTVDRHKPENPFAQLATG